MATEKWIEREIARNAPLAAKRGARALSTEPHARAAHYDEKSGRIVVDLTTTQPLRSVMRRRRRLPRRFRLSGQAGRNGMSEPLITLKIETAIFVFQGVKIGYEPHTSAYRAAHCHSAAAAGIARFGFAGGTPGGQNNPRRARGIAPGGAPGLRGTDCADGQGRLITTPRRSAAWLLRECSSRA